MNAPAMDPKRKYRRGLCDALALALHQRTNLPLGLIAGVYYDESEEVFEFCHAVVRVGDKDYIDVDGYSSMSKLKILDVMFANPVEGLRLVDATVDEVSHAFSMEGVADEHIQEANAFLDTQEHLVKLIAEHRIEAALPAMTQNH